MPVQKSPHRTDAIVDAVRSSKLSIYDSLSSRHSELWIATGDLETILDRALTGLSLQGIPLRTRGKIAKAHVCQALGYPVPASFKRTQPRFPGQDLDVYTQKSDNLQIWNDALQPTRRYALLRLGAADTVRTVRVVTGEALARLDTTGTLTHKYQARLITRTPFPELVSAADTSRLLPLIDADFDLGTVPDPTRPPNVGELLPIATVFDRLKPLIGHRIVDPGADQERNRGAALHRLVCSQLGYTVYRDDGRFPDVTHQLLELKMQTSATIDLGSVKPDGLDPVPGMPRMAGQTVRHCDVRYALFHGFREAGMLSLTHLFVASGQDFFFRFPQFKGRITNSKVQIHLPADFFAHRQDEAR